LKPDTIWAIAVDDDCEPLTGMAHLMKYTENPPDEVESRTPICGQTFRAGWMQIPADGDASRCVKCLKIEATR
jgi:hypothetical protein